MLRHIVLVYSLACISHVFGKPHQVKHFVRDSTASSFSGIGTAAQSSSSMWPDVASSNTSISSISSTSVTSTITVVTTGVAGSITVIEFPITDSSGDVSTVTSTLTDGGNGASPIGGGTTTPSQVSHPTSSSDWQWSSSSSPGLLLATKTMTIKPGRTKTALIIEENNSNETVYVEVILSTLYNFPGASPIITSNTDPAAGGQATSNASVSAPSGTGSANANRMHKRENREWKRAGTWVTMTKGKSQPPN